MTFDPFGWCARLVPERWLHRGIRLGAVLVFCAFAAQRVSEYPRFALKPLWAVETLLYVVLAAGYALRAEPIDRARGTREVLVPCAGSLLPFLLLLTPPHPAVLASRALVQGVFWWMTAWTGLTLWGMWALRRSFSITVEARSLVVAGPYRWVRHPVYLGEVFTAAGVAAWRFSWANLGIFAGFAVVQLLRSRWEDAKLRRNFPAWDGFASKSRWL